LTNAVSAAGRDPLGAAIDVLRGAGFELSVIADHLDDPAVPVTDAPGTGRVDR
jgi:hypothetical protein